MAILARKQSEAVIYALVAAFNVTRTAAGVVGAFFHADITAERVSSDFRSPVATSAAIASPNATVLADLLTLCTEMSGDHALHVGDGATASNGQCGAHKTPDTVDVLANAAPVDLATAITFLNDAKAKFNTHIASTTYHYTADAANAIIAANATVLADSITLANAYKAAFNAHIVSAPLGAQVKLIGP